MKLLALSATIMTTVLMIIHIIEQRYNKKRYAAIAEKLEKRVKDGNRRKTNGIL